MASRTFRRARFAAGDDRAPTPTRGDFAKGLVECMPGLSIFARGLTRRADGADDLVQETMATALRYEHRFEPGTNQRAWLYKILKNLFLSEMRRRSREGRAIADPRFDRREAEPPAQEEVIRFREVETAIAGLPSRQREALMMVGALGLAYEEAATVAHCEVGTMKSRVSRARKELARQDAARA